MSTPAWNIAVLDLPTLLLAGLASSAHCALMCGAFHARGRGMAHKAWSMHLGRLAAYALIGLLAGAAGGWLLRLARLLPAAESLRLLGLSVLAGVLLWRLRRRATRRPICCAPSPVAGRSAATPWSGLLAGLTLGLMPCALLYAAAGYAALSGSAFKGALLMLAFGFGTLPAVQAAAWIWARVGAGGRPAPVMASAAALGLMLLSGFLLLAPWMGLRPPGALAGWCLPGF